MEVYQTRKDKYSAELENLNKKYNRISFLRLLSVVLFFISIYYYIKNSQFLLLVLGISFFIGFILLMRIHSKLTILKQIKSALIQINVDEISYLNRHEIPFENGEEFNDFQHPYAFDLDIFGAHSLFQNLNRTATFIGKKTLSNQLLTLLPNEEIIENQEAIKELSAKLNWRQEFLAFAKISQDSKSIYENLLSWSVFNSSPLSQTTRIISYLSPAVFVGFTIAYLVTQKSIFITFLSYLFVFNLVFLSRFLKRIQMEISNSAAIDKSIYQYGLLLEKIENESFESKKLLDLQQKLTLNSEKTSIHLKELAGLFSKMDSIGNLLTATVFNGTFLYNLHVLNSIIQWKKQHAKALKVGLDVIGTFEMLNSLANFSYNNPEFVFPNINTDFKIDFSNLSHPLLNEKTRIGNTVRFHPENFVILTGSNMSGKSTFLRSLGINMVLTGIGSAVCASEANIHPLPVLVSMRLSDSLSDSESYFYAEIKRLKLIMDALEEAPAFVLLDEILRGTNSDDKRNGTIEVVKKMIANKAVGAIATHDIEVCLTTNVYPNQLSNKCFEVEIINNDLHFDYTLRDGICKNKSASFLMKKMGVI